MRSKSFAFSLMLVLLLSSIPAMAFAAAPNNVDVSIRNRSGAMIELSLTDMDQNITFYTIPEGVTSISIEEGVYSYWASLPCGNVSGTWNLNVTKTLFLKCVDDMPALGLMNFARSHSAKAAVCADYGVFIPEVGAFASETFWDDPVNSYQDFLTFVGLLPYTISPYEVCLADLDQIVDYFTAWP